jgi:hypothetical protein
VHAPFWDAAIATSASMEQHFFHLMQKSPNGFKRNKVGALEYRSENQSLFETTLEVFYF